MKQAQLKTIILILLAFVAMTFFVLAESIELTYPDGVWVTDSGNSVNFNFTANTTQATSIVWCAVYVNNSGTFELKANYTDITNATPHVSGISINDSLAVDLVGWNVTCDNGSGEFYATVVSFGVDGNTPSTTLDNPAGDVYLFDLNETLFQFTPTDTSNPAVALLYTNFSGTWKLNVTYVGYVSGVQISVNMSANASNNYTVANIPDGVYKWNVIANDSAGNSAWAEENRTFTMDSVLPTAIEISVPANNTITKDTTPLIGWKPTVEANFEKYEVIVSVNINLTQPIEVQEITSISTNETNLSNIENDNLYYVKVAAWDLAGRSTNTTTVLYLTIDTEDPEVTLITPLNNSFLSDNTPDFNVTVVDNNTDSCVLLLSSKSGSSLSVNVTVDSIVSGTEFNLTVPTDKKMDTGVYFYNIECNDTRNARVNVSSSNLQVTVDNETPSEPGIISIFHQTNSTNKAPVLKWTPVVESNFSRYHVRALYTNNNSIAYEINLTTQSVNFSSMDLVSNHNYTFNVTAYDLAGNFNSSGNTSIELLYFTDPVCAVLNEGWNVCGAVWTAPRNLTQIGAETGATFVSVWNSSHQWATCNYAASVDGQHCNNIVNIQSPFTDNSEGSYNTSINHAVWVYVNQSANWSNRTWVATKLSSNITLTNASGIGWNLEGGYVNNGVTFGTIAYTPTLRTNFSLMSLRYNNGTSVPYVNNGLFRSLNNLTVIDYGRAFWMFYNGTGIGDSKALANETFDVGGW